MARNSREPARRSTVDPADEPSAEWGWHGSFPKGSRIAGIITVILLPLLLLGHPVSKTEILGMCVPAALILIAIVVDTRRKRQIWRR